MKKIGSIHRYGTKCLILLILLGLSFQYASAQVRIPFTQRTSSYTPDRKIYNIKGDFQMIGNTNLTLVNYGDDTGNNNNMKYVDVDNDPSTLNSSSATLQFSTENGASPECSSIIYAGLYWTGRAHDGTSANTFTVNGYTASHGSTNIANTSYSMTVSRRSSNSYYVRYTFTSSGNPTVEFEFLNSSPYIRYRVNSGSWTNPANQVVATSGDTRTVTFNPVTIGTGLNVSSLTRDSRTNRDESQYRSNATASGNTKNFDKSVVRLKHANASGYQTVNANDAGFTQNIYYPTSTDGYMYSAYAEVTDYVKQYGIGEYTVADIALQEGNGGGTGFYGGWGLIVVYENSKMKWRDVTIFDGHAYVAGSQTLSYEIPVSGFNTVQSGDVNLKLGLIAGEGDRSISGDYFQIRNHQNNTWIPLSHTGNSTTNFFNSSVHTGGNPRNPNLVNNTGLDISMFYIDNPNNSVITNNQTQTRFRYGTTQDTYIIFCLAMAVDAYIPEIESVNSIIKVNEEPFDPAVALSVFPNDEIEYTIELQNNGTEAVKNGKITIPIPFTTTYVSASATYTGGLSGTVAYNPTAGATGSIIWDIGDIPQQEGVLATLTYKLKVTDDCFILSNATCITVSVDGITSGTGATSNVSFTNSSFITDFIDSGNCAGEPVYAPINLNINATEYIENHCVIPEGEDPDYYKIRAFRYCGLSAADKIPFKDVSVNFPLGTKFYNEIEFYEDPDDPSVTNLVRPKENATEYTTANSFPVVYGTPVKYYAIPPGLKVTCYWEFSITVDQYCSNYWHGTIDNNWNDIENWTAKKIPLSGEDVEFATATNNKNNPAVRDLHLDTDRIIGNLINASDKNLVITTGNQLIINEEVIDNNTVGGTIVVKASPNEPSGTLKFTKPLDNKSVGAIVEFYNKAHDCADCGFYTSSWQYFGIPVNSATFPYGNVEGDETVNLWTEPYNGDKWRPVATGTALEAFNGYQITNSNTEPPTDVYSFAGTLYVDDATVVLTRTANVNYPGVNLVGNSYTAAIPITVAALTFPAGVRQTVYLFNTGTRDQWRKLNGSSVPGVAGGQYLSVPVNLGGQDNLPDRIPSMHAFMVLAESGTDGNLTIDYSTLLKNTTVNRGNGDQIVTRSAGGTDKTPEKETITSVPQLPALVMDVIGEQSADRVWIFAKEGTSYGFDNGWDGRKMSESGIAQIYVADDTENDRFQVATVPGLDNVVLGFEADADGKYTFEFALSDHWTTEEIYLHDLATGTIERVTNGGSYTFQAKKGDSGTRFSLSYSGDGIPVDDVSAKIVVNATADDKIAISNNSSLDCTVFISNTGGKLLQRLEVQAGGEEVVENITGGTYVVRLQNAVVNDARKVVIE